MNDLETFVEGLVGKGRPYQTWGDLAAATGLTLSAFSRGVKKEGTLNVENCLRLAETTGIAASQVLRTAGKGDIAELIERLYGKADLTPAEAKLIGQFRMVDSSAQVTIFSVAESLARRAPGSSSAMPDERKSRRVRRELVEKATHHPSVRGR